MLITRVSVSNHVFATMMMIALMILGLFSLSRLPVQQYPNINFPVVSVKTLFPGASPEVVESEVSERIEKAVNTVSGLKEIFSHSYPGVSIVTATFSLGTDVNLAANDVREKVASARTFFSSEVKTPEVSRFNLNSTPIATIAIRSDSRSVEYLTELADKVIIPQLQTIKGVGMVEPLGEQQKQIVVSVKPELLTSFGVGVESLLSVISSDNRDLPVGSFITTGGREPSVEVKNHAVNPLDFESFYITKGVQLRDVATVSTGQQELQSLALMNAKPVIGLEVVKTDDANLIATANRIRKTVDQINRKLSGDVKLEVIRDSSRIVNVAVDNFVRTILEGVVLTILTVFLFLGSWRSTVITGLTLPITLLSSFTIMYIMDFSINFLTLMALSLSVGFLIDDAIVVRENIVRHLEMGKNPVKAALEGTEEIGLAVIATTLTVVAVFLPVGFMGGIIGQFFKEFGITVAFIVMVSLFVSFTLDPMMSSIWHDPDVGSGSSSNVFLAPIVSTINGVQKALSFLYVGIVRWCLNHRLIVVAFSVLVLIFSVYTVRFLGVDFIPDGDYSEIVIDFQVTPGSSIDVTAEKSKQINGILYSFSEVNQILTTINSQSSSRRGKTIGRVYVQLIPDNQRLRSVSDLVPVIRDKLSRIGGIKINSVGVQGATGERKPIEISILGDNYDELNRLASILLEKMHVSNFFTDPNISSASVQPTIELQVDTDKARSMGLSVSYLANVLRILVGGDTSESWQSPDGTRYTVLLRIASGDLRSVHDMSHLYIAVPNNDPTIKSRKSLVPISELVSIKETLTSNVREHINLMKAVKITTGVKLGQSLSEATKFVDSLIKKLPIPNSYQVVITGNSEDMQESFHYAKEALLLAVAFIYMILASQFRSFLDPVIIMTALPFSIIGVVGALILFRSSFNLFSMIGTIMLMGLVTKNGILLVDFANQSTRKGTSAYDAVLSAAFVRLRPILMTTVSIVAGMIPAAFSVGEGSESSAPMAQAVAGGVVTSSILTLIVVPVVYTLLDDLKRYFGFYPRDKVDV
ncbi:MULTISPECIES: efflux RND transporter permease subunit [Candidatus Ichthyocystis]|uniref:Putative exporter AcrB/AcrD/AcrF family n=1 Tax=Candidatus Ichthyocystis hellenicum TaxID=1561003 RepID=A0A0S4M3S7_9BURK|nr:MULTISPECIES: efflux RND transporter permease subunit [Ichthyocystis]CUT17386.1 putative exporter AcrB/AcrD/AcrF family [Candidatus Ichthyocystis hellenicum]